VSQLAKQYDESLVNYYDEQLVSQADTLYRFAYALTLSPDSALECVRRTYREVAASLEKAHGGGEANAMAMLVGECWSAYKKPKGGKAVADGKGAGEADALLATLKPLALEARAALVAVDVAGLSPLEAAKALKMPEKDLRVHLATARASLMKTMKGSDGA
jgi:DNA-directed RNA polymerase specialized sigma24 family protein